MTTSVSKDVFSVLAERVFVISIATGLVYYSYRYPLQINDSATSPTYRSTPFMWQAMKYGIFAVLIFLLFAFLALSDKLAFRMKRNAAFSWGLIVVLVIYMIAVTIMHFLGSSDPELLGSLARISFFMPIILAFPFVYQGTSTTRKLIRLAFYFLIFQEVFSLSEMALYLLIGRLPALAYGGSLVRFGGAWDDPNGFGVFMSLMLLQLIAYKRQIPKLVFLLLFAFSFMLLLLTFSYSSYTCFLVGVLSFEALANGLLKGARYSLTMGIIVLAVLLVLINMTAIQRMGEDILMWKLRSAEEHLSSTDFSSMVTNSDLASLIFGNQNRYVFNENFYLLMLGNMGLVGIFLLVTVITMVVRRGIRLISHSRRIRQPLMVRFFAANTAFVLGFAVASMGIPYFSVFPINLIFWTVVLVLLSSQARTMTDRDLAVF